MSEGLLTVEAVAEELKLHAKTVLRFIRDGRLRATKVGRQYRILPSDMRALVNGRGSQRGVSSRVRVTAIVEVANSDAEFAQRMAALLTGVSVERPGEGGALSINVIHDPENRRLKVVAIGPPGGVARVVELAGILLES